MEKLITELKNNHHLKETYLSKYATKSKDYLKLIPEPDTDVRTPFTRDIDRIIHSNAYSRYIDKTQVFIENDNDHITHRIIHVTLVAKIAKSIGRALNLNEDLIEAIALGHDIGHTPFGHLGEAFLNDICQKENIGLFAHNIQGVRTLMEIENHGQGLNLCVQTLDGIMCHNGEILNNIYQPKKKTVSQFLEEYHQAYYNPKILKELRPMTLEGCVVRISDIIGYIGRDIEDAIKIKKFKRSQIPPEITSVLGDNNRTIINTIVLDIIKNSYNKPYIKMSSPVFNALLKLKAFNFEYIYLKAYTKTKQIQYRNMITKLFNFYKNSLITQNKKVDIVKESQITENSKTKDYNRIVLDYIAGATDDFLINQYQKYITKTLTKR